MKQEMIKRQKNCFMINSALKILATIGCFLCGGCVKHDVVVSKNFVFLSQDGRTQLRIDMPHRTYYYTGGATPISESGAKGADIGGEIDECSDESQYCFAMGSALYSIPRYGFPRKEWLVRGVNFSLVGKIVSRCYTREMVMATSRDTGAYYYSYIENYGIQNITLPGNNDIGDAFYLDGVRGPQSNSSVIGGSFWPC